MTIKKRAVAESANDELAVDSVPAPIYGCGLLFDVCTDAALMSLSFEGTAPFLDWIGWEPTNVCNIKKSFINFVRADKAGNGTKSAGWLADPCADPNGYEVDYCDFTLTDFARLRRESPTRDVTKANLRYCEIQPRYRLDGSVINDQREYDFRLATEVLLQDLKPMIIDGNKNTGGQFDGLERLIKTGYTDSDGTSCPAMDSIIVDWNGNGMDGGGGITWNGAGVGNTYGLIDVLIATFRRIRHRIQMSPVLAAQRMQVGDIVLVLPFDFANCILDAFTCWSVCAENDGTTTFESRNFRDNLMGGMFGAGRIFIDGFEIPIMPYDWSLINSGQTFDMYMLTGSVGNVKIIQGQFNDLTYATTAPGGNRDGKFAATDGGRLLNWRETRHTCEVQIAEMQPRLLIWAPWAQARFEDIVCTIPGGVLSADPWNTYFPY